MEEVFYCRKFIKIHQKNFLNTLNKVLINARKVHVYMWLNTASIKSTVGNKTRLFLRPFHVSTSSLLTLAGKFRSDYVAACSTALCSGTEENESSGYVSVPCPAKVKQHSSTVWLSKLAKFLVTSPDYLRRITYGTNIHF